MVAMTGATAWTGALPGGIASMVAMMGVYHRLDCRVVVAASSGGIASMVVMTGATAWTAASSGGMMGAIPWTGALSGGIASMVAMMGVCHRLDWRVVVASSGGIASMVVMTGATARLARRRAASPPWSR